MDFMKVYENWLNSPALSADEKAELEAIRNDAKEIESRFFDQLSPCGFFDGLIDFTVSAGDLPSRSLLMSAKEPFILIFCTNDCKFELIIFYHHRIVKRYLCHLLFLEFKLFQIAP